ncbi:MAG: DUF4169 family protein [Rhodobacter sp.]|nr:DUF4169 family protein [Rhodobacter sp.]
MTAPVNLNKVRKARAKAAARKKADENAVKFGRTKAERELGEARAEKRRDALDGHRRDRE